MTSTTNARARGARKHGLGTPARLFATATLVLAWSLAGARSTAAQDLAPLQEAREQLAERELDFVVDRDLERMEADLRKLLTDVLTAADLPGAGPQVSAEAEEIVAQLLARWAELLLDQGQLEDAGLILDAGGTEPSVQWLRDALDLPHEAALWLVDMSAALIEDPAVVQQVNRLDSLRREQAGGVSSEFVDAVREALQGGNFDTLQEFGLRALPAYEALTDLSQDARSASLVPQAGQNARFDPLWWLLELDADRGMAFVQRALDAGQEVDVPRLALMMLQANVLGDSELWFQSGEGPSRFLKPEWQALVVALLQPDRFPARNCQEVLRLVSIFTGNDAVTEDLTQAVAEVYERPEFGTNDALRSELLNGNLGRSLFSTRRFHTHLPLLERLVTHPDDVVRQRAAASLVAHDLSDALLGRFADPNVQVRAEVARALAVRWVELEEGNRRVQVHPRMEAADIAILERLAADESKHVRLEAARSLASHPRTVAEEAVYLALARDPEPEVREALTALVAGDLPLRQRVLEVLSVDEDPRVRLAVAKRYGDPAQLTLALLEILAADPDSAVRLAALRSVLQRNERDVLIPPPLVERLVQDPDPAVRRMLPDLQVTGPEVLAALFLPLARDPYPEVLEQLDYRLSRQAQQPSWPDTDEFLLPVFQERLFDEAKPYTGHLPMKTPVAQRQVMRWALETGDDKFWRKFERNTLNTQEAWLGLTDEELARLFAHRFERMTRMQQVGIDSDEQMMLRVLSAEGEHPRPEVGRLLFADESLPLEVRVMGARMYAGEATPAEVDAWIAFFADTDWEGDLDWLSSWRGPLELGRVMPEDEVVRFAEAVLALDIEAAVAQAVLAGVVSRDEPPAGILREVLARWFSREGPRNWVVQLAISQLSRVPAAVEPELLADALYSPYVEQAVRSMALLKDERFTEALGTYLTTPWYSSSQGPWWKDARDGLVALMSDGAVEQLLRAAAWTTDSNARESYLEGVATIQDYHDSLANWEARKHRVATRDETVRELRSLLASDNPQLRAEAARSLGTLGAVDQLPALIRLLEDEDARVVSAVQAALDSLNAAADAPSENQSPDDG